MIDLLQTLIRRYQSNLESAHDSDGTEAVTDTAAVKDTLSSLLFAESALNKVTLCEKHPQHPKQIVVIGPTQVGKSSMVNLLLGSELAEASAMAGFTVHCQGYSIGNSEDQTWAETYFGGIESQVQSALDRQVLSEYSLTNVNDDLLPDPSVWSGTVVWDTPDFDSVDSYGYRLPVLKAAALADLIVFTVSREKYADKTVWNMLSQLAELSKPVIMVMNKTPEQYRGELADSVRQKYQRVMAGKSIGELPLHFIDEYKEGPAAAGGSKELAELRNAITSQLERPNLETQQLQSKDFIAAHWSQWTAPLVAEQQRQAEWKSLVDRTSELLVARYRSEYLDGSRNKETFQLALAELLALLEVPSMAQPLSRIRSVVTWPMRKLIATAADSAQSDVPKDERGEERRLLEELAEHGLSQLAVQISEQDNNSAWWSEVEARLGAKKEDLLLGYGKSLDNYQTLLQVEIERAAQSLFKKLQQQPVTLNGLRAARVTADAAAVVLAVKSGGLGAADLVIAPAMLSLTSMLTEGALGQYMQKVQNDLRDYQSKEVASLISRKLRIRLYPLATGSATSVKISTTKLHEAAGELGLSMPDLDGQSESSNKFETGS